jgi:hypothetical protein
MLTSLLVSIALAIGLAVPHAHGAAAVLSVHGHVTAFDTSGGGPPAVHP